MSTQLEIRNMTRSEVDELVSWAASEGWNPGLHDTELFWETDPEAFIAADLGDEKMVGGGAITAYNGEFGFMGFFIMRPEYRGRGLGNQLWHARRERLLARLKPGAAIGMDGVFTMQDYYAKGGFVFSHRNMRFRAEIGASYEADMSDKHVVPLAEVPFGQIEALDRSCFPAPRPAFLRRWMGQADSLALGYVVDGQLKGMGVIRRCREGCKIGPLVADGAAVADVLYRRLAAFGAGGAVYLDAPENNPAAMALVAEQGMEEVFGCARMYLGEPPEVAQERIFGVTTFELG
ncbi:MAG TPA: GNAT family N-acetyltransferase [Anaerolineae bacterium]|nr:GNAT family N-acetyltransferase [Anaerolineae bacterium]